MDANTSDLSLADKWQDLFKEQLIILHMKLVLVLVSDTLVT